LIQFNSILKDELSHFIALRKISKSNSTYCHDKYILRGFDEYLCSISCTNKALTEKQVTGWVHSLTGKTSSIANQVIVIRIFLIQLRSYEIYSYIPPIPKVNDDYIPYIFSEEELATIFYHADHLLTNNSDSQKSKLLQVGLPMILRLMYGCGLRIGEALSLKMENVDFATGVLTIKNAKGDKQRFVPMHHNLTKILQSYCLALGIICFPSSYLFPTNFYSQPVTHSRVRHIFNHVLKLAEIYQPNRGKYQRGSCLHCLRHVFVFKSFANAEKDGRKIDNSVPYLSLYLGHKRLRETEKYLKFSSELFPEALQLFEDYASEVFPEVNYNE